MSWSRFFGLVLIIIGAGVTFHGLSLSHTDSRALNFSLESIIGVVVTLIGLVQLFGGFREVFGRLPD